MVRLYPLFKRLAGSSTAVPYLYRTSVAALLACTSVRSLCKESLPIGSGPPTAPRCASPSEFLPSRSSSECTSGCIAAMADRKYSRSAFDCLMDRSRSAFPSAEIVSNLLIIVFRDTESCTISGSPSEELSTSTSSSEDSMSCVVKERFRFTDLCVTCVFVGFEGWPFGLEACTDLCLSVAALLCRVGLVASASCFCSAASSGLNDYAIMWSMVIITCLT